MELYINNNNNKRLAGIKRGKIKEVELNIKTQLIDQSYLPSAVVFSASVVATYVDNSNRRIIIRSKQQ